MQQVQVSEKHRIVGVPYAEDVRNLFPDAREFDYAGLNHLLVEHGPTETFMLRKLGYDVPSPILTHYNWPHPLGEPPFDSQKQTAAMLTMNRGAYVLNDMGTGKSRAALWAWDYLRSNNMAGKLLIFAPLSTLNFVWAREVFNTLPHRKCVTLHGTKQKRLERLADPDAEIYIINHDGPKVIADALESHTEIDAIVIDELAVYRNGQSARSKHLRKLAQGDGKNPPRIKWVWGMTGSPIPTCPTDAWSQARIVTPDNVPKYFSRFRDELMIKVAPFKFVPKHDAVQRAFEVLQPAVRFTLEDVIELPDCVERLQEVELGPKQAKIYKELADKCYTAVQNQEITAANAGAVMMKLLQVACGWVYASDGTAVALDGDKRKEALMDALASTSRKALVFVPFKHALAGLGDALKGEGVDYALVSGDTSTNDRSRIFNLFQNTQTYRVLVAHPACLAHGVTLTAADTIIWYAPVTSLETYEQANRRIRRVSQKHKQQIIKLQGTPVEKRIYKILASNQQVQTQLLDLFEEATLNNPER